MTQTVLSSLHKLLLQVYLSEPHASPWMFRPKVGVLHNVSCHTELIVNVQAPGLAVALVGSRGHSAMYVCSKKKDHAMQD